MVDISVQFPLQDVEDALSIVESLAIQYPVDNQSKLPHFLMTDFMITLDVGSKVTDIAEQSSLLPNWRKEES